MAFINFVTGTVIEAKEVNANFYWGMKADTTTAIRYPMSGTSLATGTSNTHDIGNSTATWASVYCDTLEVPGSISSSQNLWALIAEETLSSAASEISFSGLTGNTTKEYKFEIYFIDNSQCSLGLYLNQDSATNYGVQYIRSVNNAENSLRDSVSSITLIHTTRQGTTGAINAHCKGVVFTKSGKERILIGSEMDSTDGRYIYSFYNYIYIWSNATSEITTLAFVASENDGIGIGTNIKIWGRA